MGSQKIDLQIASRYAKALFLYALEKKELDLIEEDLGVITQLINESDEFKAFTLSPLISRKNKVEIIKKLLEKNKSSESTNKFCQLLASKKRLGILPTVIKIFAEKVAEHKNLITAELISATALEKKQVESINKMLKEKLKKEIKIETKVDPSIRGGIIIRIGSQMLDGSITSQLERIRMTSKKVIASL